MLWATVLSTLVAAASANQQQLACSDIPAQSLHAHTCLDQPAQQLLYDRLFQTNLRGPRWTGNENQNTLVASVSESMQLAGLTVEHLDYSFYAWDARWWSLRLRLKNGTILGLPTTGYWPYSGNSGPQGRTAPVHDAGTYGLFDNQTANPATLNLNGLPQNGSILFFDNPSPTRNYSQPNYGLYGSSVPVKDIPELGNLTNPHWQSAKTLNFTALKEMGVMGVIASWVDTSDEDAALQFLPEVAPPNGTFNDVPSLYVGNSTGKTIRKLVKNAKVESATVVLDAPSYLTKTTTLIGHLPGKTKSNDTILLYTHSDGPSIIEENGPILLLTMAEYFAANPLNINIDFVIETGHMSGKILNESAWMASRPDLLENAKAAIVCEHFGALEWKDTVKKGKPVYEATGKHEPMWTMVNASDASSQMRQLYQDAFEGTPDSLRMAMVSPQTVNGTLLTWYGAGGSSTLGYSNIPTVGIIPQPDYLWAAFPDGGWSKIDVDMVVTQINVILRLIKSIDEKYVAGELL